MRKFLILCVALVGCDSSESPSSESSKKAAPSASREKVGEKLIGVYSSAADWLVSAQAENGAWKMGPPEKQAESPAYTGLIVASLANAPEAVRPKYKETVSKAVSYLLSKANVDGSFGEGPAGTFLKTYTTAVAMMALSSVEQTEKVKDALRGAYAYLKQNQLKEGTAKGGLGYGDDEPKMGPEGMTIKKTVANLSATGFAGEGMKRAELAGLPRDEEFWKLVVEFVRKCQNSTEVNTDKEYVAQLEKAGLSVGDDGGLYYMPSADRAKHKAGTVKISDRETIVSYGAMTYDGIKTYLYAGLPKDSPEVKAAVDWVRKNYTIEAHPGFAYDVAKRHHLRGLYYYYLVMARALNEYGENPFVTFDGVKHDWPAELAGRLIETVKESKMWVNANPSWYEGDPVLVTSYVLITCDILFKYLG